MNHEERVRDFLNERDPSWVNQKDRGWHFDNPDEGDRYFEQQREQETAAFGPEPDDEESAEWGHWARLEAQTAVWDKPRLTPEQRAAKRMVELAQGAYSHRTVWELAELAWEEETKKATAKPVKPARDYKAKAAVLRTILFSNLKPVEAERRIAKEFGVSPAAAHNHLVRWRQETLGDEWTKEVFREATDAEMSSNGGYVVVPLARGSSSQKQPSE